MKEIKFTPEMFIPVTTMLAKQLFAQMQKHTEREAATLPTFLAEAIKHVAACQTVGQAVIKLQGFRDYTMKNLSALTEPPSAEEEQEMIAAMAQSFSDFMNNNEPFKKLLSGEQAVA